MPIIHAAAAPSFSIENATFTGLAAPSRGATETCAWRVTVGPGAPAAPHMLDREEVLIVLSGRAEATVGDDTYGLAGGDALVVPPHTPLALANPHPEPLEMVAVLPVGGRAIVPGQEPFVPPWAQ
jgi:mannose-6-phosphate isomerase-like protein (cupin superfamily)